MPNHGMTPHYSGTTLDAQVWVASFVTLTLSNKLQYSVLSIHLCRRGTVHTGLYGAAIT